MSTNENEIIVAHQKRIALRKALNNVVGQALDDKVDTDDIIAELHLTLYQFVSFKLDQVVADRYGLKEVRDK